MTPDRAIQIADQGYFWVGVELADSEHGRFVDGTQMYVEYQIPARQTQPYPLVMIHGGGGQGLDWMSTPDGRPGWRTLALQRGYAVYVIDRPGHGRARANVPSARTPMVPTVEGLGTHFAGGHNPLHTQWPGTGLPDDPTVANFLASAAHGIPDFPSHHRLMCRRGGELLDHIGPAILVANSAGCAAAWLMADARPSKVKSIVAIEPLGPSMPWGITASPMTYDPPARCPEELGLIQLRPSSPSEVEADKGRKAPSLPPGPAAQRQPEPARRLANLSDIPIAVVTGEASFGNSLDPATVEYLRQAGCAVEHIELGMHGLCGNGHLPMLEQNNHEVLDVVLAWLERHQ
ncbi:alpha/beta fold hydrolase [Paraburkholderia sp.]|uniref:alpha/beta fold hydrolase n=1 Tax=Paraburkholderia sp. TaxID=1926495 RepID=UPI003C7B6385